MTHKYERQIKRLISRLRTGSDNFILIHHDYSKGTSLNVKTASDLHILDNYIPVKLGDLSVARAKLEGMLWLIREKINFDWLIHISGQDYPIKPLRQIEKSLMGAVCDAFIHFERIHENPQYHRRPFQTLCLHRYFYRRVKLFGLKIFQFKRRHPYKKGFHCYAGSDWFNLSRTAVEYFWLKKNLTNRLLHYLRRTSTPAETLFQTILLNAAHFKIHNTDKRFIIWRADASHPEILTSEYYDEIKMSDAWFARKFDTTLYPEILDKIDDLIQSGRCR